MQTKKLYPIRYYAIGHSYLLHGPFEGWQTKGFWGMAASAPEADYFHRVQHRLQTMLPCSVEAVAENYATYERLCTLDATEQTYQASEEYANMVTQLRSFRPNLITLYIGGGNTIANDENSLSLFYNTLYTMVKENKPADAVVICAFSNRKTLFAIDIAKRYGFVPVELMELHEKGKSKDNPYYAIAQYPEYDEAVKSGAIEFRTHPSDRGHDRIAEKIAQAAAPALSQQLTPLPVSIPETITIHAPEMLSDPTRLMISPIPADADSGVRWSVDNEKLATIDRNGCLTPCNNGTLTVTARSSIEPTVCARAQIVITGQSPWYTLTYLPGTDAPVSRIPEPIAYLKGEFDLRAPGVGYLPMRRGCRFLGWSDVTDGENDTLIEKITMDKDRTVRANWCIADCWDFDTMYDSAGVRMGGFNVRYENSIARVSSATGTGASVYHEMLELPMKDYSRFALRMKLDCEQPEKGILLQVTTTEKIYEKLVHLPAQTMGDLELELPGDKGIIIGFSIKPQMTDCCIYVDRIAFEP